jgi:hypothetical protein
MSAGGIAAERPQTLKDARRAIGTREYALPAKGKLRFDASYDKRLAEDVAKQIEGSGEPGRKLAGELRSYKEGERPSGMEIWRGLSKFMGDDTAMEVLGRLGFRSVEGINAANYTRVFPSTTVRDAHRAKFDPARMSENDIYGKATPEALAAAAALAGGGFAYRNRGDE